MGPGSLPVAYKGSCVPISGDSGATRVSSAPRAGRLAVPLCSGAWGVLARATWRAGQEMTTVFRVLQGEACAVWVARAAWPSQVCPLGMPVQCTSVYWVGP